MQYTPIILFLLGVLGILTHFLIKINGINRRSKGNFQLKPFIKLEWPSFLISLIVVVVALIVRSEVKQLKIAGAYLGLGFFAIGYMAQSILLAVMSKYEKQLSNKDDETPLGI